MVVDPAAPLKDNSKPSYVGVDEKQVRRYCGFYASAKGDLGIRAEQHRNAGREASVIGEGFRQRGFIEQAIRWHLQDAWHHHSSFDCAKNDGEREEAVVGEVDAWGAVAACCRAEADGTGSAKEWLVWLQHRCAYYHRALQAAERPGSGTCGHEKRQ